MAPTARHAATLAAASRNAAVRAAEAVKQVFFFFIVTLKPRVE